MIKKTELLFTIGCIVLIALTISACGTVLADATIAHQGQTSVAGGKKGEQIEGKSLLFHTFKAMTALSSVHFELTSALNEGLIDNGSAPASLLQSVNVLGGPHNTGMHGKGDETVDRAQISIHQDSITAPGSGRPFALDEVIDKDTLYILGTDNNWYKMPRTDPFASPPNNEYTEYGMVQVRSLISLALHKGVLSDLGYGTIGSKRLRHVRASYDKGAFDEMQAIDAENYTWVNPDITIQNKNGNTEFWIDENSGYVYQLNNVINYVMRSSGNTFSTKKVLHFQCSRFNQAVDIPLPSHASPIDLKDPMQIHLLP